MECTFRLNRNFLKAVRLIASTDGTRYVLCGVALEVTDKKRVILTATDGRRLLSLDVSGDLKLGIELPEPGIVIIPSGLIDALPPDLSKEFGIEVKVDDNIVTFTGKYSVRGALITGKYPQWREAVPKCPAIKTDTFAMDLELLATFGKASLLIPEQDRALSMWQREELGAWVIVRDNDPRWLGVIMPLHTSATFCVPEFAKEGK